MIEDEFLVNYVINMLEEKTLNPGKMQINLTGKFINFLKGFLNFDASGFMKELWNLLLSAQSSQTGIVWLKLILL